MVGCPRTGCLGLPGRHPRLDQEAVMTRDPVDQHRRAGHVVYVGIDGRWRCSTCRLVLDEATP